MGILIPLTPKLRAFGKSWTDSYRCHIFNVLKDANITIAQFAVNFDMDERTIRRDITALQKLGILHRGSGRKDGRWVIQSSKSWYRNRKQQWGNPKVVFLFTNR